MNIFEYAMQMERDGEEFYRGLADNCRSQGMARILAGLANDEAKHYRAVEKLAEGVEPGMADTTILTDARNVFAQMQGKSFKLVGPQVDMYRQAQEIERQSHDFYKEKAEQVTASAAQAILLKIADEEQRHFVLLDHIIEFMDRPRTWLENAEFNHLDEY
jgi:rubrerythrin